MTNMLDPTAAPLTAPNGNRMAINERKQGHEV